MKKIFLLIYLAFGSLKFSSQNKISTDTVFYSSEFNFFFYSSLRGDSVKAKIKCSKEYFFYFLKDKKNILIKEYFEDGILKSKGQLKAIGPFDKKLKNLSFVTTPVYDKKGNIIEYKDKTIVTETNTKIYYLEKSGDWTYYDEINKSYRTEKHIIPKDPQILVKKRLELFNKRCDYYRKKYPKEKQGDYLFKTF